MVNKKRKSHPFLIWTSKVVKPEIHIKSGRLFSDKNQLLKDVNYSAFILLPIKNRFDKESVLKAKSASAVAGRATALLNERFAICTFANGGVCFVSCHLNMVESAIILISAVVFALLYRAFNRSVGCLVFHDLSKSFRFDFKSAFAASE